MTSLPRLSTCRYLGWASVHPAESGVQGQDQCRCDVGDSHPDDRRDQPSLLDNYADENCTQPDTSLGERRYCPEDPIVTHLRDGVRSQATEHESATDAPATPVTANPARGVEGIEP